MSTRPQGEESADAEKGERLRINSAIGKNVMVSLGQPADLHRVQVRRLWEHQYRVNVLVGADASSAKVAHSYFLLSDGDGNVVASSPEITKHY